MFCLGVGIALSSMSRLSMDLIESHALEYSALSSEVINEARNLYSTEVVSRAKTVHGITVTHDYTTKKGAIPNPATYVIELGSRISANDRGALIRLYSDYPFPHRQAEGGPKDDFEWDALKFLRQYPTQSFFRQEQIQGRSSFRYAEAIIMEPSCIACHNSHPDSPRMDWKVGEVRGVLEIIQPLDKFVVHTQMSLRSTFITLGGLSVLALSGLILVIGRLRQTAKELKRRVRERTAALAEANQDLEKRNQIISQIFGRYLSKEVVDKLLEKPEELKLGGQRKTLTILTSDLRGFTALSERLLPEEVVQILNLYLKYMSEVITKYQGTIDKFMGDGILVLFGAPTAREDDTKRAVACAVAMQLAMVPVNETMNAWGYPPLEMGIGINTGDVVVGNIGSEKRTDYSVVGSQVNLTYRIESYTIGGQILISESTFEQVKSIVMIHGYKQVQPKGVKQPITIYQVVGIGDNYNLFIPKEDETFFPLTKTIPLTYKILEGKHIGKNLFLGSLIQLSAKGGKVRSYERRREDLPVELSNISLNILNQSQAEYSDDIYAKVTSIETEKLGFYIRFTSQPPEVKKRLDALYKSINDRSNQSPRLEAGGFQ
ncbi:adenylate/guanylate cyclase domain-containing protein [Moorena producens]|uniref:adenylate/guanylate cyclase domain-containing protein n=1 Tax=Moorena producens TaxID=1155739 RepID=UPI003C78761B